jgi:hypothetical protein
VTRFSGPRPREGERAARVRGAHATRSYAPPGVDSIGDMMFDALEQELTRRGPRRCRLLARSIYDSLDADVASCESVRAALQEGQSGLSQLDGEDRGKVRAATSGTSRMIGPASRTGGRSN